MLENHHKNIRHNWWPQLKKRKKWTQLDSCAQKHTVGILRHSHCMSLPSLLILWFWVYSLTKAPKITNCGTWPPPRLSRGGNLGRHDGPNTADWLCSANLFGPSGVKHHCGLIWSGHEAAKKNRWWAQGDALKNRNVDPNAPGYGLDWLSILATMCPKRARCKPEDIWPWGGACHQRTCPAMMAWTAHSFALLSRHAYGFCEKVVARLGRLSAQGSLQVFEVGKRMRHMRCYGHFLVIPAT